MEVKKFNLFEANIKDNKGVPSDYIESIDKKAKQQYGTTGPSHTEMRKGFETMMKIQRIQNGNESKLTEIGKEIIMEHYGDIIDGVVLDIKIVKPNDREKREIIQKTKNSKKPLTESVDELTNEIEKRKILNVIMQGEAQNVQNMMFSKKDEIDKIDSSLLDLCVTGFEINKKFDWMDGIDLEQAMNDNPDMANAMEIDYEKDGEERPIIRVRALDLPMLIHETVKGIYELIMAHAIPEDSEMARKIMDETDTLKNEQEDVKYGPFIASDIRDYINDLLKRKTDTKVQSIPNIKEFIYGRMSQLDASTFIDLIKFILGGEKFKADSIMTNRNNNILDNAVLDAVGEEDEEYTDSYQDGGKYVQKFDEYEDEETQQEQEQEDYLKPKIKSYSEMSQRELENELNDAIDNGKIDVIKAIQPFIKIK